MNLPTYNIYKFVEEEGNDLIELQTYDDVLKSKRIKYFLASASAKVAVGNKQKGIYDKILFLKKIYKKFRTRKKKYFYHNLFRITKMVWSMGQH